MNLRRLILCADDFSLHPVIDQAIVSLLKLRRLNAVSCMCHHDQIFKQAKTLLTVSHDAQIGMHLNLTEGYFCSVPSKRFFSLSKMIWRSSFRLLSFADIEREVKAQLDQFTKSFGRLPDFIDGHQHVHVLPVVREALMSVQKKYCPNSWLRLPIQSHSLTKKDWMKSVVISRMGGYQLKKQLIEQSVQHNQSFSGIYDFNQVNAYRDIFNFFIQSSHQPDLIMCHPANGLCSMDEIALCRQEEYDYFSGDDFLKDLNQAGLTLF